MFESLTLKFTESPNEIKLETQGITIFVGPNNSGKSLVLREIESASQQHQLGGFNLLSDFEIYWLSEDDVSEHEAKVKNIRPAGTPEDHVFVWRFNPYGGFEGNSVSRETLLGLLRTHTNKHWVMVNFLRHSMVRLDGKARFELSNDRPQGDLVADFPANALAGIFVNEELRQKIRDLIYDSIGRYFVIDPTSGGQLRIRLSSIPPTHDEQSLNAEARNFHKRAVHIKDFSDGIQAYVGIIVATYSSEFRAILIDEPEAFLHPPLARKLGFNLANAVLSNGRCLFASTHSPDFLMGCLQASSSVRIVRLEYSSGKSKGRVVDAYSLSKIYKSPLMRSANVLSALFYDGVIVTESDNDRVFYQEIYLRLAESQKNIPSILFVNAQNKQTIKDIIGPLRNCGVPAAAIVDIDVIKDGGKVWSSWLQVAQIPAALHDGMAAQRDSINKLFLASGKDMKRDGVKALSIDGCNAADILFNTLSNHGVFVVKSGELENWLPDLSVDGRKTEWVLSMLERLGNDPASEHYVRPREGDVWSFVRTICSWAANPARKGVA